MTSTNAKQSTWFRRFLAFVAVAATLSVACFANDGIADAGPWTGFDSAQSDATPADTAAAPHAQGLAIIARAASESDMRNACRGSCGSISDDDVRNYCRGDCGSIDNSDTRNYCRDSCGSINDSDMRNLCRGSCGSINNSDVRNYCRGDCGSINDANLRNYCRGSCGSI